MNTQRSTSLQDKKILVTGSSVGIGKAIAEYALAQGAKLFLNGRDADRLAECCAELNSAGLNCQGFAADVGQADQAQKLVERAQQELGGIDILINNAGWGTRMPLGELDPAAMEAVWRTNVLGSALMAHYCLPHLEASHHASIVNIASTAGKKGYANGSSYCSSKFALRGMTECWQAELRPKGIRVILVNPSEVQTGFGGRAPENRGNPHKLFAQDIALSVCQSLEMPQQALIPEVTIFATNPWAE